MNIPPSLPNLEFIAKLGEGGMSSVWKAHDFQREETVAVKILNKDLSESTDDIERFRVEARTMSDIHHVGIVRSYELNCFLGVWYYTMEYVDGYNFSTLLDRKRHLSEADCLLICESVAVALDYAWNDFGIVHCDIKPDNIMINTDGVVKLTDLGLCHKFQYIKEGTKRIPDHVMGTPAYISPEQVYGDVEPDCRADIYSLAATLYHLSTGRTLFPGRGSEAMMRAHCDEKTFANDPRHYQPDLTESFCQLLEAMLVKNRKNRLSSWTDVCKMCVDVEKHVAFKARIGPASSIQLISPVPTPEEIEAAKQAAIQAARAAKQAATAGKQANKLVIKPRGKAAAGKPAPKLVSKPAATPTTAASKPAAKLVIRPMGSKPAAAKPAEAQPAPASKPAAKLVLRPMGSKPAAAKPAEAPKPQPPPEEQPVKRFHVIRDNEKRAVAPQALKNPPPGGKVVIKKHIGANPKFKIHQPVDW